MGFDDFDFNDPMDDLDYFEYMNRIGMYDDEDIEPENDLEDDLLMSGIDPNDLEFMSASERRRTLEDAGLDPDDYDDLDFSGYSSRASGGSRYSGTSGAERTSATNSTSRFFVTRDGAGRPSAGGSSSTNRPTVTPYNAANRPAANRSARSNGKWSLLEFIIFVTIFGIIGFALEAIVGEIIATAVIIIIGIAVLKS